MVDPAPRRPIRVCVMTSVHPPFDTRVFHREAKSMAAAGFRMRLIGPGAPDGQTVEDVRFSSLPAIGGRAGRPLRWPILMWKAMKARADIYHFHDPELLPWGVLLHWLTRKPVVYDAHEFLREDIRHKHWIPSKLRKPVSELAERMEKWCAGRLSAVVTVTDEMTERFRPYQKHVVTVRNLPPAPKDGLQVERKPIVIYAGLLNIDRGLGLLRDIATIVHAEVPEAEFHILGTVEWHGIEPAVARMSPEDWAAIGVTFFGTIPQPEVAPRMAQSSVGWLPLDPSVANAFLAWPIKLVEYMAAGVPVVASDLPIQAKVIDDADCGIVVDALNSDAHAKAMVKLLRNPAEIERLGANGKRAALSLYTWEGESDKLQSLYRTLVSA